VSGNPRDPEDRANIAIPLTRDVEHLVKGSVTVLRRLHVIIEDQSDMRIFSPQSELEKQLLAEYDLISIAPRSDAVFQAACSYDAIDIVTLDGTSSSSNSIPYTIRSTDVRAIRNRKAVLEIPYAVPILNRNARKGLVQTCRNVVTASLGGGGGDIPATTSMIPILLSSGIRSATGSNSTSERQADVGSIALRTPDDLVNVLQSVLSFDTKTAIRSVSESGHVAIKHGIMRQKKHRGQYDFKLPHQNSIVVCGVEIEEHRNQDQTIEFFPKKTSENPTSTDTSSSMISSCKRVEPSTKVTAATATLHHEDTDGNDEEGFIAL
jgi:hypothetical protein